MQGDKNDVIFTMDIKDVLAGNDINGNSNPPRAQCEEQTDFEDWVPSDESGVPECILGRQYTYRRVARTNRAASCFLRKDYELPPVKSDVRCSSCGHCMHACAGLASTALLELRHSGNGPWAGRAKRGVFMRGRLWGEHSGLTRT